MTETYHLPVHGIRIAGGGPRPYPCEVRLPSLEGKPTAPEDRQTGALYLEELFPQNNEHHTALALFMQAWGHIETQVQLTIVKLIECDGAVASSVFLNMGLRQAGDLVFSLSTLKLQDDAVAIWINLQERLSRLAAKRNTLVHGKWVLEVVIFGWRSQVVFRRNLLREALPTDRRLHDLIAI